MFKVERNVTGGMKALLGIFLEAVLHNAFQRRRNVAVRFAQVRGIFKIALIVSAAVSR
jgi:hypothetical protein